jgi:hypothetical protein
MSLDKRPGVKCDLDALDGLSRDIAFALQDARKALEANDPMSFIKHDLDAVVKLSDRMRHLARYTSGRLAEHLNRNARVA